MKVFNGLVRAELKDNYCYVRDAEGKFGVIDALIKTESKQKKVAAILSNLNDKNFSQVWGELLSVKGVKFEYAAN